RGNPITVDPETGAVEKLELSNDVPLEENYLRDAETGKVLYSRPVGGGDHETSAREVRVLYYNYYQYKNGYEPSYLFGTDSQGYDMALRLAKGVRLSILVAVCVSVINFIIGGLYGAIEGYYGGVTDLVLERISDILAGVPFIVVATLFQIHLAHKVGAIPSMLFAFVMTGWIGTASRMRTQFYRFKNQEYVMAARTLGARDRRIIWKHIFPNTLGTLITSVALVIPSVVFNESMLSYLGIVNLGGAETTSLGTLLSDASKLWQNHPHLMIVPAVVISLMMICFNLFGNGLRDAFNPSLRGVEE
ncbi:MAG: ABC transporter permease, partial [Oscillospiraceae bacterium]|nr:ABC transporter permease [Oscillospiraceae bacterium]